MNRHVDVSKTMSDTWYTVDKRATTSANESIEWNVDVDAICKPALQHGNRRERSRDNRIVESIVTWFKLPAHKQY
ncbi:hypothetical protein GCM10025858_24480 [Alicyclobacillus sacchari]|nr:hypothetical protein GCM10025858_24480 [Alicyclobacillus sacchari]